MRKKLVLKKGWTKKEVDKTLKILKKAEKNKHPAIKVLDELVYWLSLILTIIGNLIISIVLIPFLYFYPPKTLYLLLIVIASSFGLLFELLIRSMSHLKTHHHIFYSIFVPGIAIINFFIIFFLTKNLSFFLPFKNIYNPFIVSFVYIIFFMLPYLVYQLILKD